MSYKLWQACWIVINAYFDEKGLVRQQLDSFCFSAYLNATNMSDENDDSMQDSETEQDDETPFLASMSDAP
uniref:Uncharacterized protein n=1 Tax=Glossina morsitans morsitans TaxID=37546 RepID=A0A1B0GGJ2_GLOMM